ncbi:MAG: hypothetical protein KIT84_04965 [Labilithrix sp.]|nr:hypothetical protein [Labilithrix sp.]MCW5810338.1 hypothetical protein [Labilithrix sp.]
MGGAGATPAGSRCVAGAATYMYTERPDGSAHLHTTSCDPTDDQPDALLTPSYHSHAIDAATKERITSTLAQHRTVSRARCTPGARYEHAVVIGDDENRNARVLTVTDDDSACVLWSDRTFVDLAPVRALFEELAAAPGPSTP